MSDGRNIYNNLVLIGNWSEERLKNEYFFKLFLRKRDRKELLLQRSRILFSNLLNQRPLEISGKVVMFGYNAQIVATDIPMIKGDTKQYGLALSSLVTDRQIDYMQNINDGCMMTLSPIMTPCCRNTFLVESFDGKSKHGDKVKYGQEFLLRAVNYAEPNAPPLYVRYSTIAAPGPEDRACLHLSTNLDPNCRFTAMPFLPKERLEAIGSPVQTGKRLVIRNCVADKNLCVMNQNWMLTFFGPECGITVKNCVNIHKLPTAENIFNIVSDIETKKRN